MLRTAGELRYAHLEFLEDDQMKQHLALTTPPVLSAGGAVSAKTAAEKVAANTPQQCKCYKAGKFSAAP